MNKEAIKVIPDSYKYNRKSLVAVFVIRLALLCVLSVSTTLFFVDLYSIAVDKLVVGLISVGFTAFTYLAASLLPSAPVYGGIGLVLISVIWFLRDGMAEYALRFCNFMLLRLDSRLLRTSHLVINDIKDFSYEPLDEKTAFACFIAVIIFSLICSVIYTASFRTKLNFLAPIIIAVVILVPATIAEISGFSVSVIFLVAAVFALYSVRSSYDLDNVFVYGELPEILKSGFKSEKEYKKKTRFLVFLRKLSGDLPRYGKYSSNAVGMFVTVVLVFSVCASVIPDGTGINLQQVIKFLTQTGESLSELAPITEGLEDNGYFSDSGNKTLGLEAPTYSNEPVLEVTLERNDIPVYLRGDIGVNYTSDGWTTMISEYENFTDDELLLFNKKYYNFDYYMYRGGLEKYAERSASKYGTLPDEVMPVQTITLEYLRRTDVLFMPAGATLTDDSFVQYYGDHVARIDKWDFDSIRQISYQAYTPVANNWLSRSFTDSNSYVLDYVSLAEGYDSDTEMYSQTDKVCGIGEVEYYDENYTEYVNSRYCKSDPEVEHYVHYLKTFVKDASNSDRYVVVQAVCNDLKTNYRYSLTADNGETQVLKTFLNETETGHCALFASAAVLALRGLGIPARYVTGYLVSGEGEAVEGGYKYVITEKNLHAWIEVYFEDKGWIPFDPTAGAEWAEDTVATTTETEAPAITTTTTTASKENSDTTASLTTKPADSDTDVTGADIGDGTERPEEFDITVYIPYIIAAGIVAVIVLAIVIFVRSVNAAERKVIKGFAKKNPNDATALMYRFLIAIYERLGAVPETEFMSDFAERVDKLPIMKNAEVFLIDVIPIFEKCEFGSAEVSPITEEERAAVYRVTMTVYRSFMNSHNRLGRFFLKISFFL